MTTVNAAQSQFPVFVGLPSEYPGSGVSLDVVLQGLDTTTLVVTPTSVSGTASFTVEGVPVSADISLVGSGLALLPIPTGTISEASIIWGPSDEFSIVIQGLTLGLAELIQATQNISLADGLVESALSGADIITGSPALLGDELHGFNGNDEIRGRGGPDLIYGGNDDDMLYGGAGGDSLYGEAGSDTLYGGLGSDKIYGQDGADQIFAGAGADQIFGGAGDDEITGGGGKNEITGGGGADTFILYNVDNANFEDLILDFSDAQGDLLGLSTPTPGVMLEVVGGDTLVKQMSGSQDVIAILQGYTGTVNFV